MTLFPYNFHFKSIQANHFVPNWGTTIFQSANEIVANTFLRKKIEDIQSTVKDEREWWDKKKARIQEGFLKELEMDPSAKQTGSGSQPTPFKQNSSDDDAVLVESGGPAAGSGGSGKNKKKKGKKWCSSFHILLYAAPFCFLYFL